MKTRLDTRKKVPSTPTLRYSTFRHPLVGELLLVADGDHLVRSIYTDCESGKKQKDWIHDPSHPVLRDAVAQLGKYLEGKREKLTIPLRLDGSDFQRRVYQEVLAIPLGHTLSYSDLARKMNMPAAARSVGAALGKNQLLIFVPDHRVISQSGATGGFGGKWNRKPGLLELEERMAAKSRPDNPILKSRLN